MKITHFLPLLLLTLLLAACSGDVYARAYTASGDGQQEDELNRTEQFTPVDDLNVVIKLNRHKEAVQISVRFIDPNDETVQEIQATAESDVGTVVMGVDYEGRSDQVNQWLTGRYRVEIRIDDELVDTLFCVSVNQY